MRSPKGARSRRRLSLSFCLIAVGVLALIAGLAIGGYNLWDDRRAGDRAGQILQAMALQETAAQEQTAQWGRLPVQPTLSGATADPWIDPERDMPTVEVDGASYIGVVSIPVLDLELPVMETWSYPQLKIAPCRYAGSAYLNDMILCAHNYATHFGRLGNLIPGDEVVFTDVNGDAFVYEVALLETLEPTAVEEMESGGWDLTLFTCTLGGQTRVTVRCVAANGTMESNDNRK